jgi:cytoplasmic iron level regulating protein YaaA (DUF328/UPF0246 family)
VLYVLVPPSEGKAEGGSGRWKPTSGAFGRRLGAPRQAVVEALGCTTLSATKLGATGPLLERALAANAAVAAGTARALPAHRRYTGVVWEHLDAPTLDDEQRARTLVPSAILGLATANDPVPDHRTKLDVSLDGIGRLDRYWKPHVTDALLKRTTPADTIVELLPNEHRAAIDLDRLAKRRHVVRTTVVGVSGHDAKAVKGALARHLLVHGDATGTAVDDFAWHGWSATLARPTELIVSR